MHLISLCAWMPQWLDPQKSAAPAKLVYAGLVLLVFAVVHLQRWVSRKRGPRRSAGAPRADGMAKPSQI